jgi:nicotinate-nucleotide adenylyltransferase
MPEPTTSKVLRIGVFGGSFDPPHAAHAALAQAAQDRLSLDVIIWLPTFAPPHKGAPAASFADRLAMVSALVADEMKAAGGQPVTHHVSDLESTLPQPSYTVHTLAALRELYPAQHGTTYEWFLVVGADNWAAFPRWHQPEEVLKAATLVVYPRAGFPVANLPSGSTLLNFPQMPHQSTDFRAWLARDREGALAALPPAVADCIRARGLYTASPLSGLRA